MAISGGWVSWLDTVGDGRFPMLEQGELRVLFSYTQMMTS